MVLKKSQYINDCPATLDYTSINDASTPLTGFSTAMIEGITPGKCIAYKITATGTTYSSNQMSAGRNNKIEYVRELQFNA